MDGCIDGRMMDGRLDWMDELTDGRFDRWTS